MLKMIFMIILILLSFTTISVNAQTLGQSLEQQLELTKEKITAVQANQKIKINIQKMPVQWQDKFGDVLYNATKYWEKRFPSLKFYSVPYPHQADFVVTWASQYLEGKLGYYTSNTNNEYGKPYVAITLGYFKDKKWNLVSREYVIEITKHELGHAIGLKHSNDPKDIMYPYIHDYKLWLMSKYANSLSEQKVVKKSSVTSHLSIKEDWKNDALKYKKLADSKIAVLKTGIQKAEESLYATWYETAKAQDEVDKAWTALWWAKKYLGDAEWTQREGQDLISQLKYKDAYYKYRYSYDSAKKIEPKLFEITDYLKKAHEIQYGKN